ncbi:MAG: hypothetical protein ACLFVJ_22360 [Persicimonas sp.]
MTEFLNIALSFPTVIFSGMLILVVMYWLMAIVGAVDIELFDFDFEFDEVDVDIDFDADVDADIDADVDAGSHGGFLHAMMAAIGLGRVPVTIIGSILTLVSWFLCFTAVNYLGPILGTGVFVGLGVVIGSVIVGLPITSLFTHPLKGLFEIHTKTGGHSLVGKLCKVTSGRVTETFGRGEVDDGGAGLLVSIRCETAGALTRGSRALLIEYDADAEVFFVEPYDDLLADDPDDEYEDEVAFEDQPAAAEIKENIEEPTA